MDEEIFQQIGLTDKETKVYLASLKLGSSLVQSIAHTARLNRTSVYDLLSSLEKKGFVSYVIKSGKKFYHATPPNKLLSLIKEREILIKKILPELNSISSSFTKKPEIEVYSGKEGLKSLFERILEEAKEFDCLASKDYLLKLFEYYFPHFVSRRIKNKIKVRIISDSIPLDKEASYKLIKQKIKTATWLYNNKIIMVSLEEKEPIGILIDEKNFYETQKIMFDLLWENLR